jgi:sugar transferase (PEP-CTERM system associated)
MRLLTAVSLGIILLATLYFVFPSVALWRSNLAYAMPLAVIGPMLLRIAFAAALGGEAFRRRILVLGAGSRAARIADLASSGSAGFIAVGFVAMTDETPAVPMAIHRTKIDSLADHVVALNAGEVVLALEERRNALPLDDLLRIKTTGVHVNEISSFLERETGRVDLATVNPSWFIFSDGFTAGQRVSKVAKRLFDIVASLLVLILMGPVVAVAAIIVKLDSVGPAFYRQRRVGLYGQPYNIFKLRSMRQDAEAGGKAIWAAEADPRITRIGRFLRMTRIDEIPQAWNVLKGEMSFVGPRPERPEFVQELEREIPYYAERHMVKPGLTGWAQINYPYGASIDDARCKLEYDLYYAKNYTPFLDVLILLQTLRVVLWPEGVR